jgi:predicted secreted protein
MPQSTTILAALAAAALALPAVAGAKTVHRSDSGKTVTLAVGEKLVVKLKECGPCGFRWRYGIAPDKALLPRRSSTYIEPDSDPMTVGGAGTRKITYRAKTGGKTKLRLDYVGPSGDKGGTFRLTVKVTTRR